LDMMQSSFFIYASFNWGVTIRCARHLHMKAFGVIPLSSLHCENLEGLAPLGPALKAIAYRIRKTDFA
jgi:hypothetical protein